MAKTDSVQYMNLFAFTQTYNMCVGLGQWIDTGMHLCLYLFSCLSI